MKKASNIPQGIIFEGAIDGTGNLRVDGTVRGPIAVSGRLSVGKKGRVEGDIEASHVEVAGEVHGDVEARERVAVVAGGQIDGDVLASRVQVAEGAKLRGQVEMPRQLDLIEDQDDAGSLEDEAYEARRLRAYRHAPGQALPKLTRVRARRQRVPKKTAPRNPDWLMPRLGRSSASQR